MDYGKPQDTPFARKIGLVKPDMIERVARAMLANSPRHIYADLAYLDTAKRLARAAIAAMRDCTPAMLDAGSAAHPAGGYVRETLLTDIIECEWWAMIDAALEEK